MRGGVTHYFYPSVLLTAGLLSFVLRRLGLVRIAGAKLFANGDCVKSLLGFSSASKDFLQPYRLIHQETNQPNDAPNRTQNIVRNNVLITTSLLFIKLSLSD